MKYTKVFLSLILVSVASVCVATFFIYSNYFPVAFNGYRQPQFLDLREFSQEYDFSTSFGKNKNESQKPKEFDISPFPFDIKCFERLNSSTLVDTEAKIREDFEFLKTEEGKEYKKILVYYDPYHNATKSDGISYGNRMFVESCCSEKRCFLTNNKNKLPLKEYDALIFHLRGFNASFLPKERSKHQRWIMVERESPAYSIRSLNLFSGVFNWTMTYRRDSDIQSKYGFIYRKENIPSNIIPKLERTVSSPLELMVKNKTKMAAWLVSHCDTLSGREMLVHELAKYIDIDVYGRCTNLGCGSFEQCHHHFESSYRFYLSFENSICKDYITEKFFNVLRLNIIPVVFGAGDYSVISPPHSYIDARSFETPKKLAEHLIYLSKNDEAYMEYFKWRENYIVASFRLTYMVTACHLCQKLHEDEKEKTYVDMTNWYHKEAHCKYCTITPGIQKVSKCYDMVNNNIEFKRFYLVTPRKKKKKLLKLLKYI